MKNKIKDYESEIIDTSIISPYDDYEPDDIYVEPKKKTYSLSSFYVGELPSNSNSKEFNGYSYEKMYDSNQCFKTNLSCFYGITSNTYLCLFNGKKYNINEIKNLAHMRDFIPIYSTNIKMNITMDEAIKYFKYIIGGNKKFKFNNLTYDIRNFSFGNLKLKTFSAQQDEITYNNTLNHILLEKSNSIKYKTEKEIGDVTNFYNIYETIFYTRCENPYQVYCIGDNHFYYRPLIKYLLFDEEFGKDKNVSNLVPLKKKLSDLNITSSDEYIDVNCAIKYQKKIYNKQNKLFLK